MSHDYLDSFDGGMLSSCCQAKVMLGGFCSHCKEHCDIEPEEREFTPEQQATIERMERDAKEPT